MFFLSLASVDRIVALLGRRKELDEVLQEKYVRRKEAKGLCLFILVPSVICTETNEMDGLLKRREGVPVRKFLFLLWK